jgi:hypothetical protein
MQTNPDKKAGIALIIFTVLMTFTMVLHPVGGNIQHLLNVTPLIMITHGVAVFSLPFAGIGFWGLTKKIGTDHFMPMLAFFFISFGLIAVMMAATANGLVMPLFLQEYKDISGDDIDKILPVLDYSFSINHAFDYIYTIAFCTAILLWSVSILITKKLPAWVGWLGVFLAVAALGFFITGVAEAGLQGFRIFVSSIVLWILAVGISLVRNR